MVNRFFFDCAENSFFTPKLKIPKNDVAHFVLIDNVKIKNGILKN